jgi:1-acyl-sn-glycerol-3-phosphate acyltransferase
MPSHADRPDDAQPPETSHAAAWGRPAPYRGLGWQIVHYICGAALALSGWKIRGDWPALKKGVLIAAPHTSNWDGVWMLAAAGYFRITIQWMGKASLTQGPFGGVIKALGCVPVDRSARHDLVQAMARAFAARETMLLAVPPEGTRSLTPEWKSGFYHIANTAGVPIILTVLDYGTRTIRVAGVFQPTGDYEADLPLIQTYYRDARGRHRSRFSAGETT